MTAFIFHALPLLLFKSTLLLAAAMAVHRALRRASASTRHVVWAAAVAGVLVLPILSLTLPSWNVAVARRHATAPAVSVQAVRDSAPETATKRPPSPEAASSAVDQSSAPIAAASAAPEPVAVAPAARHGFSIPWALLITAVWMAGFALALGRIAMGMRRVNRAWRGSRPLDPETQEIADSARQAMRVRRRVAARQASEESGVVVPITWGALHPVVLLPPQSGNWSAECRRAALLHEFAHVRRGDWVTQTAARLAGALYWFHPMVWIAARQARETSELACDDCVLHAGVRPSDYAQRLLDVLRSLPEGANPRTVAIAMALPRETEGRIQAMLAPGVNRRQLGRKKLIAAAGAGLALLIPVSILRPMVRAQASPAASPESGEPPAQHRQERGILQFLYLKDVACPAAPQRPIRQTLELNADHSETVHFWDRRTKQAYPDAFTIQSKFQKVLEQGYERRAGATAFVIPQLTLPGVPSRPVYFTAEQQRKTRELIQEQAAWTRMIENSPIILTDSDVVNAKARMSSEIPASPSVNLIFTPEGVQKLAKFSAAHRREVLGIFLGDKAFSASVVNDVIQSNGIEMIGGFRDLAEAETVASRLNAPVATETISRNLYRSVSADGKEIIEMRSDTGGNVRVADGYQATLSNGRTVEIENVTRAIPEGGWWTMHGAWWLPDGSPAPAPASFSNPRYSRWPIASYGGLPPYAVNCSFGDPSGDSSQFTQVFGVSDDDPEKSLFRSNRAVSGAGGVYFFPRSAKSFSMRIGVSTTPWKTEAILPAGFTPDKIYHPASPPQPGRMDMDADVTLLFNDKPALAYFDAHGNWRVEYFLGRERALGNVARRIVAVDQSDRVIPLEVTAEAGHGADYCWLTFSKTSELRRYNPGVDLAQIKEFRLQTRPYEIVEFRNIQLQPLGGVISKPFTPQQIAIRNQQLAWAKRKDMTVHNMKLLGLALMEYIQDNDNTLPAMTSLAALRKDLAPYIAFQEKQIDLKTGTLNHAEGGDIFISPLSGKPYRPSAALSHASLVKIDDPHGALMLSDTPTPSVIDGNDWVCEAFADGHVKIRRVMKRT
ncbi:M56 family metallopeptidase [Capsulimonas corticalis]|uniref:M56 family metallopeptidase n=1 Tax=Capsulimonas corticalis TaxID=2219043 RepID=UPI001401CE4E|nr:M56 family metallopeptidase [Capsulimonas corticalis]